MVAAHFRDGAFGSDILLVVVSYEDFLGCGESCGEVEILSGEALLWFYWHVASLCRHA